MLYEKILNEPLDLTHENLSKAAKDLLSRMLEKDLAKRIKPEDVKKHGFFATINFDDLLKKEVKAPYIPKIVCVKRIMR